jgi:hypothetical protein
MNARAARRRTPSAAPTPMPADAPALRPPGAGAGVADGASVGVGFVVVVVLLLLPVLVIVAAARGSPVPVVLGDDDEVFEAEAVEVVEEVEVVDDVVPGSASSPNAFGPVLRSSPIRLNVALFSPSMPSTPVRMLNQQGVADVKLSRIGTLAVNPGAFCW